jgi:hypothetical protein
MASLNDEQLKREIAALKLKLEQMERGVRPAPPPAAGSSSSASAIPPPPPASTLPPPPPPNTLSVPLSRPAQSEWGSIPPPPPLAPGMTLVPPAAGVWPPLPVGMPPPLPPGPPPPTAVTPLPTPGLSVVQVPAAVSPVSSPLASPSKSGPLPALSPLQSGTSSAASSSPGSPAVRAASPVAPSSPLQSTTSTTSAAAAAVPALTKQGSTKELLTPEQKEQRRLQKEALRVKEKNEKKFDLGACLRAIHADTPQLQANLEKGGAASAWRRKLATALVYCLLTDGLIGVWWYEL